MSSQQLVSFVVLFQCSAKFLRFGLVDAHDIWKSVGRLYFSPHLS